MILSTDPLNNIEFGSSNKPYTETETETETE